MTRRWQAGEQFEVAGLPFRVEVGKKPTHSVGDVDLRLDWWTPQGWVAVPMDAAFRMGDFFYENEHVLYPPGMNNWQGGEYFVRALTKACRKGWRAEADRLNNEKRDARMRDTRLLGGDAA